MGDYDRKQGLLSQRRIVAFEYQIGDDGQECHDLETFCDHVGDLVTQLVIIEFKVLITCPVFLDHISLLFRRAILVTVAPQFNQIMFHFKI